jgi:uncharacterized membrane protein YqjE
MSGPARREPSEPARAATDHAHTRNETYAREAGTGDPYAPREPDADLPQLISRLTDQSSTLFRQEIELAKTELKQEIRTAGKAGGLFGGAALAGFLALLLLSFAVAWALGDIDALNPALGFLIVGAIYAVVAGVLAMQGRNSAEDVDPSLPHTTASLKEDARWAKNQPR